MGWHYQPPLTEGLGLQNWTEGELVQTPGHHFFLTWRKRNGHYQPPLTEGLGLQNWTENKRGYEHWILCHQGGTGEAPRRHWNSDWGGTEVGTEGGTDVQNLIPYPYLRVNWSRLDWPHQPRPDPSGHLWPNEQSHLLEITPPSWVIGNFCWRLYPPKQWSRNQLPSSKTITVNCNALKMIPACLHFLKPMTMAKAS